MAADAPTPASDTRGFEPRSRAVAEDLGGIFRAAPDGSGPAAPRARAFVGAAAPLVEAPVRRGRLAGFGALAAAGVVGLLVGAALVQTPKAPPPGAPAPVVQVASPAPAAPMPAPAPPSQPVVARVETPPAAKAAPARVRAAASGCQALKGNAQARCAYPAVLAADKRLRRAYARATRAGVPRATLASYRDRWAALRRRADDQPMRVLAGYRDMAGDLDRLASRRARS